MAADEIIRRLDLAPHPEGGWYRETWRSEAGVDGRAAGTAIFFLLRRGERSHWHRVDADETWHFYRGGPLALSVAETAAGPARRLILGPDVEAGMTPQIVVPKGHWQAAQPLGDFTLAGCTVAPGFRFEGFELAPPGFDIPV